MNCTPRALLLCSFLVTLGCGGSAPSTDPDASAPTEDAAPMVRADGAVADAGSTLDAAADAAPSTDGGAPSDAGISAEFVSIYDTILAPRCVSCHMTPGTGQLYMPNAATAYAQLVDHAVWSECPRPTDIRVVPFDPDNSVLMLINADGPCGRRHNILLPPEYLESERDADVETIRTWIAGGAL